MMNAGCSRFHLIAALVVVVASASVASASWMTIRNDTGKPIVVQETIVVNGQIKRGKPIQLLPGESLREFAPASSVKKLEVYDTQTPNQAAWAGSLTSKDDPQTFSVSSTGGKITVNPVATLPPTPKK